jgi:hypothetical protein
MSIDEPNAIISQNKYTLLDTLEEEENPNTGNDLLPPPLVGEGNSTGKDPPKSSVEKETPRQP